MSKYGTRAGDIPGQKRRRKRRHKAALIKLHGGRCIDCGWTASDEFDAMVLDFHHREPSAKDFEIGGNCHLALSVLVQEAAKCDLLCCRCHRLRHIAEYREASTKGQLPLELEKIYCALKSA